MRRVIGFAIVAAGVSIMFLHISTESHGFHLNCGTAWHAMFSKDNNDVYAYACSDAAFPRLWIAGGVVAAGMGIAFWGVSRVRLLVIIGLVLLFTALVNIVGLVASAGSGGV